MKQPVGALGLGGQRILCRLSVSRVPFLFLIFLMPFLALLCATASDSNIKYLGRSGVANVAGLSIAFLDGTYNAAAFREGGGRGTGCRYYGDLGRLALSKSCATEHKPSCECTVLRGCPWV